VKKKITQLLVISTVLVLSLTPTFAGAQPYGTGKYGNLKYGDTTSLSISTDGSVDISVTPTVSGVLATGASSVTVSTTDVKGYKLYIRALTDTNMNNLGMLLPASGNGTPAPLAINTWGYNTDASTNFVGILLSDSLIRSVTLPIANSITNVTYGVKLDMEKSAGKYTVDVIYTAVPQTY
jgi:hypothetical protein